MAAIDLQRIALLIGKEEPSVLKDYLDQVANQALLPYKAIFQYGGKKGESLYTHAVNGIFVLETLRSLLCLKDDEVRVLFTAFTVHDINKALARRESFGQLATAENVGGEIRRLGLGGFFPDWQDYLADITSLDMPTGTAGFTNVEYSPYHVCSSRTTLHKVYHNEKYPSHLLLPVIPQD